MTDREELKNIKQKLDEEIAIQKANDNTLGQIISSLVYRLLPQYDLADMKQLAVIHKISELLTFEELQYEEMPHIFVALTNLAKNMHEVEQPVRDDDFAFIGFIISHYHRLQQYPKYFWAQLGLKRDQEGLVEIDVTQIYWLQFGLQGAINAAIKLNIKAIQVSVGVITSLENNQYDNLKTFLTKSNIDTVKLFVNTNDPLDWAKVQQFIVDMNIFHLDLAWCGLFDWASQAAGFFSVFNAILQRLESLSLKGNCINKISEQWDSLIQCFADSPLKRLNLSDNDLAVSVSVDEAPSNWNKVCELLRTCKKLQHLNMFNNDLQNLSADQWLLISPIIKQLESCNLGCNALASLKGEAKTNFLKIFSESNLGSVCLKSNGYFYNELNSESVTFEELLNAFKSSSLREVNLNNNGNLTNLQRQELIDVISQNLTKPLDMKAHPTLKSAMLCYVQANRSTLFQNLESKLPVEIIEELDAMDKTIKQCVKF